MRTLSLLALALWLAITPVVAKEVSKKKAKPAPVKVGIALSGGAARGFAHIGVLQALEDYGIVPDYVAGASMGAVIGAVYASGMTPAEIYEFGRRQKYFKMFKPALLSTGALSKSTFIHEMLDNSIPHNSFDSLQKKLFVSVTNLNTMHNEIWSTGDKMKEYVVASASIPFVFEPKVIDTFSYVDGGLTNNLPVNALTGLADCDHIIGVTVHPASYKSQQDLNTMGAVSRVMSMIVIATEIETRKQCHDLIVVNEAANLGLMDFNSIDEFYQIGYNATVEYIKKNPDILKLSNVEVRDVNINDL